MLNGAIESVNAAALILGAAGLVSRILGVLRDRLLAAHFGAGRELDIYYAAFQIPDFMSILFLLGAGSAAILPIFQEYLAKDPKSAYRLISNLFAVFFLGAVAAAGIAFVLAPHLMRFVVPGFSSEERALTVTLTRIMLLSPIFLGISSIFSSVVESFQRFWTYALAPLLYNVGIILGVLLFVPSFGLPGLAVGVIAGAVMHAGVNLFTVRRLGFFPDPRLFFRFPSVFFHDGVWKVLRLSFPRVLSVSFSQLTIFVLVLIGSTLVEGSIAVFQLAQNLYALPIGIFGVSYAVALFPRLSRAYITRDAKDFFNKLFFGIRTVFFWIAPSMVLTVVLRAHIVRVALGAGVFSWEDTRLTAAVLAILTCAMLAGSLASLLIKGFYALENTWIPLSINIGASLLSVGLALFFTRVLGATSDFTGVVTHVLRINDLSHPEVVGLALGFSIGLIANIFFLYRALRHLAERTFKECYQMPVAPFLKIIIAACLGGVAAYFVRVSFAETLPLITFSRVLAQGAIAGCIGLAVYFGTLFGMREEDVHSLWRTVRHKLFRIGVLPPSWDGEHLR